MDRLSNDDCLSADDVAADEAAAADTLACTYDAEAAKLLFFA